MRSSTTIKSALTASLLTFLLNMSGLAQSPARVTQLDSLFSSLAAYHFIYGNVLVAADGKVLYQKSTGFTNIREGIKTNAQTTFELASLSKVFTAVAIMQLYEKHQLRLDDQVARLLPEFPFTAITVRQLLSHTSGLPDFDLFNALNQQDPKRIMTNADIIPALKALATQPDQPGQQWKYSSPGIGLLALIVEKKSGLAFKDYLARFIFKPAGMAQSYLNSGSAPVSDPDRAIPYELPAYFSSDLVPADTAGRNQYFLRVSGGVYGPGLLVSSIGDMFKFDKALFSGKLVKKYALDTMLTPVKLNDGSLARAKHYPGEVNFGLGWFICNDPVLGKIVFHSGFKPGTSTILLHNLTKQRTVILLDHGSSPSTSNSAFNALRLLNGMPTEHLRSAVTFKYGDDLLKKGPDYATIHLQELRRDTLHYTMTAIDWIAVAYDLLRTGHTEQALQTFQTGYTLYPDHPFLSQIYADVLVKANKKDEAIMLYQRSLKLNPKNEQAVKALKLLEP